MHSPTPPVSKRLASRIIWILGLSVLAVASVFATFSFTDDTIMPYQDSDIARHYTFADHPQFADAKEAAAESDFFDPLQAQLPAIEPLDPIYGSDGPAFTAVFYDGDSEVSSQHKVYAIAIANLATHFGKVHVMAASDYEAGSISQYTAAIVLPSNDSKWRADQLMTDLLATDIPILWVGTNITALSNVAGPDAQDFEQRYGWHPTERIKLPSEEIEFITYKDKDIPRYVDAVPEVHAPVITLPERAEVLAGIECPDLTSKLTVTLPACPESMEQFPWVLRSGNLTQIIEFPLYFMDINGVYLVFADLYYDLLAPDTPESRTAAVRIEDVNPQSDPNKLREIADYLYAENVPFQVALVPIMMSRTTSGEDWYGYTLLESPKVIEALKYMQERGGTIVQHGTTHQYGPMDNPYNGQSTSDYEFYVHGCSETEHKPYEWTECHDDSWIRSIGAVPFDSVADHRKRLAEGIEVLIEAGLGKPEYFVTPHYSSSPNGYLAMAELFKGRYEQGVYYSGLLPGEPSDEAGPYGQSFPYSVHDIYGSLVMPENLQNIREEEIYHHPIRLPEDLISWADTHLVIREANASYFFHPFLDLDLLAQTVEGIKDLGYEFVPIDELR